MYFDVALIRPNHFICTYAYSGFLLITELIRRVLIRTNVCLFLQISSRPPNLFDKSSLARTYALSAELIRQVFTRTYAYFRARAATDRILTSHFCTRTLCPACFRYRCPAPYCFFVILVATHRLISMRLTAPDVFQRFSMLSIIFLQSSF